MVTKEKRNAILAGAGIGLVAGSLVALGGAIKDAPMEGFKTKTFFRSPLIGTIVGAIIRAIYPKANIPLVFLGTIGGERIVVETIKIIRVQIPGKFIHGEWGMKRPVITQTVPMEPCVGCTQPPYLPSI